MAEYVITDEEIVAVIRKAYEAGKAGREVYTVRDYLNRPLVRCRDCKHYYEHSEEDLVYCINRPILRGDKYVETEPYGYCAWGERRGGAMPIASVRPGCAHEQACGHADVTHCADRVPAAWCSCDMLRNAEAERDEWRRAAESKQRLYERARMSSARDRRAMLRAEAERDRYRAKALSLQCVCNKYVYQSKCAWRQGSVDEDCERVGFPCRAVIEEVDGA